MQGSNLEPLTQVGASCKSNKSTSRPCSYRQAVRTTLENQPNLMIFQQPVEDLIVENDQVTGAVTAWA